MVHWTSACYLLLGVWVTCSLLVPQVTVAHSLKQKSADEDLVFEDDDNDIVSRLGHASDEPDGQPVVVIGGNDEDLPDGAAARPRVRRQYNFFPTDDEDTADGSGVGSGDGSGRYRLGFMMLTPLVLHLLCVDISVKKNKLVHRAWLIYVSVVVEAVLASVITLLVTPPLGSLTLSSCRPRDLRDWYPIMYNPNPNYEGVLYCTQEAVYPMYTMVLVGYSVLLVLMLVLRPAITEVVAQQAKVDDAGAIYSALYLLPSLSVIHALFAGVVYTVFPYLVIVGSIISIATYLAYQGDQRVRVLIRVFFRDKRSVLILLGHWCLHAYGIIALTQLTEPVVHASLCALVPVPALFYVLTARFSDPTKVQGCSIPPSTGRT